MTSRTQELDQVLKELRQVEREIERYLLEQAGSAQPEELTPASARPESTSPAPRIPEGTEDRMRDWGLGASDEIQAIARVKVEARSRLAEAESGVRLSSALLMEEVLQPSNPENLLTLALMQSRHRASANLAVEQLLQLEGARVPRREPAVTSPVEPDAVVEPLPAAPSGLEELRQRHHEISARLSALSADLDSNRPTTLQFREQRTQLNALMARLSRDESSRMSSEKQDKAASESDSAPSEDAGLVPALPSSSETEGRRVFWRANRARIHTLTAGKVIFAGPFAGYRHLLIVDHGDGWSALYGNMTDCYVKVDQKLSGGSVLGEYQAEKIGDPEPFWIEVRRGAEPRDVDSLPGVDENWQHTLFEDQQP